MVTSESRLTLLWSESAHLQHYLHTLPPDAWNGPSACAGWDIRTVVAHLIVNAEFFIDTITRGLRGDTTPLPGWPEAGTAIPRAFAERINQMTLVRCASLGDQVLMTFDATLSQLSQVFARLGPTDWETPCYHFVGLRPPRVFLEGRLSEVMMHGWDIRAERETSPRLSPEGLPLFMDRIASIMTLTFQGSGMSSVPVRYRFQVGGELPGTHDIVLAEQTARMEPAGTMEAQAILQCDTETFILLAYGRLSLATIFANGRVTGQCEEGLLETFDRCCQGF